MAAGWPTKANYATGDVLSATNMNDLSGTVNYIDPTSATDGQVLTRDAASAGKVKWATPSGGSGSTNVAGKNGVLNSNFSIWQRGTSVACSSTAYAADRWQAYRTVAGATVSRQVTNDTTNLPFIQYCARVQRDSGNTSTTAIFLGQSFETVNSIPYVGKTVTISFYARAGANYSSASNALTVYVSSGTGTDQNVLTSYTGANNFINQTATLTTTWQRFSYSGTVPTTATELGTYFFYTPVGTAGANDYYEITGVQIEIASSASAYSPATPTQQAELAACQRYFFKLGGEISAQWTIRQGGYYDANYIGFYCPYPQPMRTAPSITTYGNPQVYQSGGATSGFTWNNTISGNPSTQNQYIVGTKTSHGLTVNLSAVLYCATTSDYIGVSAEL